MLHLDVLKFNSHFNLSICVFLVEMGQEEITNRYSLFEAFRLYRLSFPRPQDGDAFQRRPNGYFKFFIYRDFIDLDV
jgi:hypothetical protein